MPVVPLSIEQIRKSLQSGFSLDPTDQFTYSIPGVGSTWESGLGEYDGSNPQPVTDYSTFDTTQAANFIAAIEAWDELIAPDFQSVPDDASGHGEVRGAFTSHNMGGSVAGYAFQGSNQDPTSRVGDVWIDSGSTGSTFAKGTQDYQTFLHEIGHVLGLQHSFIDDPGDPTEVAIPAPYENTRYTLLSYTPGSQLVTFSDAGGGFLNASLIGVPVATPMVLDIAYIQDLYGADTETRSGDTTYTFNEDDAFLQALYDAGGTDTFDLSAITRPNVIDLNSGAYSSVAVFSPADQSAYWQGQLGAGGAGFFDAVLNDPNNNVFTWNDNVGIAFGTVIENVLGGSNSDVIVGNRAQNLLRGNGGNDTMDGGVGLDSAMFSGDSSAYNWTITRGQTQIVGPDGTDTFVNVEIMGFSNASYELNATGGFDSAAFLLAGFGSSSGGWASQASHQRLLVDVDGNGRADIVGFGQDGVYVSLSTGDGFGAAYQAVYGFGPDLAAGAWAMPDTRTLADINGDGRADVVGFGQNGVYVSLATGSGAFGSVSLATYGFGGSAGAGGWSTDDPRTLADVNGDGRADIVGFGANGVYVALADGQGSFGAAFQGTFGFGSSAAAGGWTATSHIRTLADIDGDGQLDLVGFGHEGVWVSLGAGDGTFGAASLASNGFGVSGTSGGWAVPELFPRHLGDLNGDGRADVVGFNDVGTWVALGAADGSFEAPHRVSDEFGFLSGWGTQSNAPRLLADFDGDGNLDIVGFGQEGVYAAYGDGAGDFANAVLALDAAFGSGPNAGTWGNMDSNPRFLVDITNDGAADVIGFSAEGVIAATSQSDWVLA